MKRAALIIGLWALPAFAEAAPRCAKDARAQAAKLLVFHFGSADDRTDIDEKVKALAPLKNPANKKQTFDVLEVWGSIYKARYRMRFIYAQLPDQCVLMGQEILEHASP